MSESEVMQKPSPPPPGARFSLLALASALFGLPCIITGPVSVFLGWVALQAINRSDGRLRGRGLAIFGLAAGGVGCVLLGLGLVAVVVNAVRARSQRAECQNNLKQIALAVNVCADHSGHKFPTAVLPLTGQPPEEHFSWQAGILPFLEERPDKTFRWQPLASKLDFDRPWDDPANLPVVQTRVARFLCPSHPPDDPAAPPGLTDYVGITGLGIDAASLPADDPRAGFFGYDRVITMANITAGASTTLLATETTLENGPWAAGGQPTVRGVDPRETRYIGPGRSFGGCHRSGPRDLLTAAYVDASVRFITSEVDPHIFRNSARITRDSGGK
jgi:hypothetical protein